MAAFVRVKGRVHGGSGYNRSCAANFSVSVRGQRDVGRRTGVSVGGAENCRGRLVGRSARRGLEFNEHLSVRGDLAYEFMASVCVRDERVEERELSALEMRTVECLISCC